MKQLIYLVGVLTLSGVMVFMSCKKDDPEPPPVDNTPVLTFMTDTGYISQDVTLEVNSEFKLGVIGSKNPNSSINIATFKVVRTFNNVSTTVYEETSVGEPYLTWESNESAVSDIGEEKWTFTIMDYVGQTKELSFEITTEDNTPFYQPSFSPTYLIVNQGGVDVLDFYITCTSDDWEMIKVIVTYPGGLGNETYVGNGQIMTAGAPFTFSNYFPKLTGTWTFSILGNIKSGPHVNESFTVIVSLTVTGK